MSSMMLRGYIVSIGDELNPSYLRTCWKYDEPEDGILIPISLYKYSDVSVGDKVEMLGHICNFEIENRIVIGFEQGGLEILEKAKVDETTIEW